MSNQIEHAIRADAELPRDAMLREADVFREPGLQSAVLADQPHQLDRVIQLRSNRGEETKLLLK